MSMAQVARQMKEQDKTNEDWFRIEGCPPVPADIVGYASESTGELQDPRTDMQEDSALWEQLFKLAKEYELAETLHGFRCMGTNLVPGSKFYKMVPLYGKDYWPDEGYYQECRKQYLAPHAKELTVLLTELFQGGDDLPAG